MIFRLLPRHKGDLAITNTSTWYLFTDPTWVEEVLVKKNLLLLHHYDSITNQGFDDSLIRRSSNYFEW